MGTRADFYVGRGPAAEWIGSTAWDGNPAGFERDHPGLLADCQEHEYRVKVGDMLAGRDDATLPEHGWPWPWDDSNTTDYAYAWEDGIIYTSNFGRPWVPAHPVATGDAEIPDDEVVGMSTPEVCRWAGRNIDKERNDPFMGFIRDTLEWSNGVRYMRQCPGCQKKRIRISPKGTIFKHMTESEPVYAEVEQSFPDMKDRKNVTHGGRSGIMLVQPTAGGLQMVPWTCYRCENEWEKGETECPQCGMTRDESEDLRGRLKRLDDEDDPADWWKEAVQRVADSMVES